jgi:hypothetical protein
MSSQLLRAGRSLRPFLLGPLHEVTLTSMDEVDRYCSGS